MMTSMHIGDPLPQRRKDAKEYKKAFVSSWRLCVFAAEESSNA